MNERTFWPLGRRFTSELERHSLQFRGFRNL